jgi:hypothetical protein
MLQLRATAQQQRLKGIIVRNKLLEFVAVGFVVVAAVAFSRR